MTRTGAVELGLPHSDQFGHSTRIHPDTTSGLFHVPYEPQRRAPAPISRPHRASSGFIPTRFTLRWQHYAAVPHCHRNSEWLGDVLIGRYAGQTASQVSALAGSS